jgi:hypothetical protein
MITDTTRPALARVPGVPFALPFEAAEVLKGAVGFTVATNPQQVCDLAVRDAVDGFQSVAYEVPGRGLVEEAQVCRVKNGIAANYPEAYMRRRDPDCMIIGDERPTDKPTYQARFGTSFAGLRNETFDWLKQQKLILFPFISGADNQGVDSVVIAPENAAFFAYGLALLQGMIQPTEVPEGFAPKAVIYIAPPFRHTHFQGKQVVVHNRLEDLHELFAYNLYPGPSAKKGVYGVLLHRGEEEGWITMHCSTVEVITPYDNRLVISHEGASGGGKSEMLEYVHREEDGRLLIGENLITGKHRHITLPTACKLHPITDDMAICHPSFDKGSGKLSLQDAENAWFLRINHITKYGVDPLLEGLTTAPPLPLLFLNIQAHPKATALIWEHTEDKPGVRCPNPRVVVPRSIVPDRVDGPVEVDIRSFGVRCPPCTKDKPSYGILGLFHLLPPSLAWLWRLVAPRGHDNPSIVGADGLSSEGVGSYWPFATGSMVGHANLLLEQILQTPKVRYLLIPNQHIGSWKSGFMPQWIAREYLARRGGAKFTASQIQASRCALLGYTPDAISVEGTQIPSIFFRVEQQPEVGIEAYDKGAAMLTEFFRAELRQYLTSSLHPLGREIIQCCMEGGSLDDYDRFFSTGTLV